MHKNRTISHNVIKKTSNQCQCFISTNKIVFFIHIEDAHLGQLSNYKSAHVCALFQFKFFIQTIQFVLLDYHVKCEYCNIILLLLFLLLFVRYLSII